MSTETIDPITDRVNADPDHAARVTVALEELADAAVAFAVIAGAGGVDGALLPLVRTMIELRARLVTEHGEDAGRLAWRDAMGLHTRRIAQAAGIAPEQPSATA